MTYLLASGTERQQRNPEMFWIPSTDEKSTIRPGNSVKLIFLQCDEDLSAERMWVTVTSREGASLRGTLANWPHLLKELKYANEIEFEPDHIIAILCDDPEKWEGP